MAESPSGSASILLTAVNIGFASRAWPFCSSFPLFLFSFLPLITRREMQVMGGATGITLTSHSSGARASQERPDRINDSGSTIHHGCDQERSGKLPCARFCLLFLKRLPRVRNRSRSVGRSFDPKMVFHHSVSSDH